MFLIKFIFLQILYFLTGEKARGKIGIYNLELFLLLLGGVS